MLAHRQCHVVAPRLSHHLYADRHTFGRGTSSHHGSGPPRTVVESGIAETRTAPGGLGAEVNGKGRFALHRAEHDIVVLYPPEQLAAGIVLLLEKFGVLCGR